LAPPSRKENLCCRSVAKDAKSRFRALIRRPVRARASRLWQPTASALRLSCDRVDGFDSGSDVGRRSRADFGEYVAARRASLRRTAYLICGPTPTWRSTRTRRRIRRSSPPRRASNRCRAATRPRFPSDERLRQAGTYRCAFDIRSRRPTLRDATVDRRPRSCGDAKEE